MQYEPLYKIFYKNNEAYEKTYQRRFDNEFTQHYNFTIGEHQAFLVINLEILNLITNIISLDKRLLKAIRRLPNIALFQFTRKCIVDEIQLTNEIEGVHSTRKEIRELIEDKTENRKSKRLYGLVQKYLMLSQRQKIELKSCQDIRKLYDEFVLAEIKEDNPDNVPDGEIFRKDIVEVVSPSQKVIHKGMYPETKIITAMTAALDVLNGDKQNYLVNLAVFHYMFGYIHPFYDGNGRMARFISSYLLTQQLEPIVGFGLSNTIKNKMKKYYEMFKETNDSKNKGDLTPFVIGFLQFIEESIEFLCTTIEAKVEQYNFYKEKIGKITEDKNLQTILVVLLKNALFDDEEISVRGLVEISRLSPTTVRTYLKKIPKELLVNNRSGKMNLFSLNLDVLGHQ